MAHLQFGLQGLMTTILACGVWLALLRLEPHVTLFLCSAAVSVYSCKRIVAIMRHTRAHGISRSETNAGPAIVLAAVLSWSSLYVLSLGPALVISSFWRATQHVLRLIYTPLVWLHEHTSLKEPLEWYAVFWLRPTSARSAFMFGLGLVALVCWVFWPNLTKLYRMKSRVSRKQFSFKELIPWLFRPEIRRISFAILGVPLAVGGALAILTGLVWLVKGLPDADQFLAKGLGASVVGLASLWMAFHPRSPLRGKSEP